MTTAKFQTTILQSGKTTTGIEIPAEVVEGLGAGRKPAVRVTLDGEYTYRSTVAVMAGRYMVGVNADVRKASGVAGGDAVEVTLELDTAPRVVEVPEDLAAALDADPAVRAFFDGLSYSNRRWHAEQVAGAKTDETRRRRIEKSIALLADGKAR